MMHKKIAFCIFVLSTIIYSFPHDPLSQAHQLLSLGNHQFLSHNFNDAVNTYKTILSLYPTSSALYYNMGYALNELADYQGAAHAFRKSCALQSTSHAYLGLATALLAQGNYEEGWQLYEKRWDLPDKKNISLTCPRWNGIDAIRGKKIILLAEGALGDCLQFIRYARSLKEMGASVTVMIPEALKPLCSLCPYIDHCIAYSSPLPQSDYYTSLMSLPALLKTTLDTIPSVPYLYADENLINQWRTYLSCNTAFNIGVCWQADPQNDAQRPPAARRSIPAHFFTALSQIPGVAMYNLQYPPETVKGVHSFTHRFDTSHGRFMDTAAIMRSLNLVISVDTATAHLAGALNVPVWLILPYKADWRWIAERDDSPWYPSMRIFRQKIIGDWESVFQEIIIALKEHIT